MMKYIGENFPELGLLVLVAWIAWRASGPWRDVGRLSAWVQAEDGRREELFKWQGKVEAEQGHLVKEMRHVRDEMRYVREDIRHLDAKLDSKFDALLTELGISMD